MATTINGIEVKVKVNTKECGYHMDDLCHHNIREVREAIKNAQDAMWKLLDLGNGESNELLVKLHNEAYNYFLNSTLNSIIADTPTEVRSYDPNVGHHTSKKVDFADLPFIRAYIDNDYSFEEFEIEGYDELYNKVG